MDKEFNGDSTVRELLIKILNDPNISWNEEDANRLSIISSDAKYVISVQKHDNGQMSVVFRNVKSNSGNYFADTVGINNKDFVIHDGDSLPQESEESREMFNACVSLFERQAANKREKITNVLSRFLSI